MTTLATLQDSFVQRLPAMQRTARLRFRHLPPEAQQEAVSNTLALAWKFYYALFRKGRAGEPGILTSCVFYAVKQTKIGRTPQGCPKAKDALGPRWIGPTRLADCDLNQFVGSTTPVPDQVSFRMDVPEFLATLSDRQRKMAIDLAFGMTTTEAAAKYSLSLGRISQFRREFKELLEEFFAE